MIRVVLAILALGVPAVCLVLSAKAFKSDPPNPKMGWGFALLGVAITAAEVTGVTFLLVD